MPEGPARMRRLIWASAYAQIHVFVWRDPYDVEPWPPSPPQHNVMWKQGYATVYIIRLVFSIVLFLTQLPNCLEISSNPFNCIHISLSYVLNNQTKGNLTFLQRRMNVDAHATLSQRCVFSWKSLSFRIVK